MLLAGWKYIYNPNVTEFWFFLKEYLLCDIIYIELLTKNI